MKIFSFIFISSFLLLYINEAYGQDSDEFLTVLFIDLGREGDSTLVIFPNGNTMLIDGGLKFDESFEKVTNVLEENNVDRINLMIASHADADHIGGLARLLAEDSSYYNKIDEIWTNGLPHNSNIYDEFVANIEKQSEMEEKIGTDQMSSTVGLPVSIELSPPPEGITPHSDHASEQNSNSLVTRLQYGNVSFLFTADTTWTTEEWLVENKPQLIDVDIMNAPHHGSKYASDYRDTGFIQQTSPKLVIFSADAANRYEHPHEETKIRYNDAGIRTLQTGISGNIVIKTDGERCSLLIDDEPEQPCFEGIQTIPEFDTLTSLVLMSSIALGLFFIKRLKSSLTTL